MYNYMQLTKREVANYVRLKFTGLTSCSMKHIETLRQFLITNNRMKIL